MASLDKELESQLLESGNQLVEPPPSVDDLLPLLYRVESYLSKVEQSPAESMQTALAPSLKALVDDKLLGHSDVDVKVAVASCISEITRITAPEAPYDDDQMRVVFQLIVSSFENLSDDSSRSYSKRTSILETVAKVRSCVVMLDLECDTMIVEMFQHFLNAIRDHHPENVFSSMETIMILVLEESEDISVELLSPILASLQNDNEQARPMARKLGEKVLERCATKVRPYLLQALKTLGSTVSDYSKVVATICQDADNVEQNKVQASDGNMFDDNRTVKPSTNKEAQEVKVVAEGASLEKNDPSIDSSSQPALSNGVTQSVGDDSLAEAGVLKKQEDDHPVENAIDLDAPSNANPDSMNPEKEANAEEKPEEGGREGASSVPSIKPSESPHANDEKAKEELNQEGQSNDITGSPHEGPSAEAAQVEKEDGSDVKLSSLPGSPHEVPSAEAAPMDVDEGSDVKPSSPQTLDTTSADAALASPSGNALDESRSEKTEPVEKESSVKEAAPSADGISKRVADMTSDTEVKPTRPTRKKVPSASSGENKASAEVDVPMKDSEAASDSEEKPLKQSVKKGGSKKATPGSSTKQEDKKKPGLARARSVPEKDAKKTPKDNIRDIIASPKSKSTKDEDKVKDTPKPDLKRKRTPGKAKETGGVKDFGESLVGSKVKVWWPDDREYYDGTIHSFDPDTKKHKVLYTDGDVETLNLKRERWEFIGAPSGSDEEDETARSSPDGSTEMTPKKKSKTKSGERTKLKKVIEASPAPKKSGGGSSSKPKVTTTPKSRSGKPDSKSKDEPAKSVGKSEDASGGKSKDQVSKGGSGSTKSTIISFKSLGKLKNESQTPKVTATTKLKEESTTPSAKSKLVTPKAGKSKSSTPKTTSASKDKSSSANGTGKAKSSSSKVKESENVKEDSLDSDEMPAATTKGKSSTPSKGHGSDSKSGKKRRRSVKG